MLWFDVGAYFLRLFRETGKQRCSDFWDGLLIH